MDPTNIKNPFQSRTIWGLIITAVGLIGGALGADVDKSELKTVVDQLNANWDTIAQVIGLILALYGRFKANKPITFKKPPASIFMVGLLFLVPMAHAGDEVVIPKPNVKAVIDDVVADTSYFFADVHSSGFFPTGANQPLPLADYDASKAVGGGAALGYRFNEVLALSVSGQWIRTTGVTLQHYTADLFFYIPREEGSVPWLPDFISIPDINGSQLYGIVGGGWQTGAMEDTWILRAGLGVEMPILPSLGRARYFIDGFWNVPGISSTESGLEPYVTARMGIRIPF